MHRYASQTPEARELVVELEFVWDQIKYNASSSSSSSPLQAVGVPSLSRHQDSSYGSIGGRLAQSSENHERPNMRGDDGRDSRLRVLSPVSQPDEEEYYRRRSADDAEDQEGPDEEDDDEENEEFEEARDSLYEVADHASTNTDTHTHTGTDRTSSHRHQHQHHPHHHTGASIDSGSGLDSNGHSRRDSHDPTKPQDSRWRRRVEQALTKMTAEIAAVREQMESRTLAHRRRSGLWAWLKWILWVVMRQIIWDLALLGVLLIVMRMRGDRRVEDRLRTGWSKLKARLGRVKLLKQVGKVPLLP